MSLINLIKGILNIQREIDVNFLPSQGLFYKNDFEIFIKKADMEDIIEYEYRYEGDDVGLVLTRLKKIVQKNTIFSNGYSFEDIKSIDVIYIFLEIVQFTNNKIIEITYFNDLIGQDDKILFGPSTFNYCKLDSNVMSYYDSDTKEFIMDGYRYSIPSIGVENCLTQFLIAKSYEPNSIKYNAISYDFLYFLGHKSQLSFSEIENLIQIFNEDLSQIDKDRIRNVIVQFSLFGKYSLKRDSQVIEITSKIDLEKIWK